MDVIESRKKKNFETFSRSPQHIKNNQHNSVEENSRNRSQNNQILGGGIKSNIPVNGSDRRYGTFSNCLFGNITWKRGYQLRNLDINLETRIYLERSF